MVGLSPEGRIRGGDSTEHGKGSAPWTTGHSFGGRGRGCVSEPSNRLDGSEESLAGLSHGAVTRETVSPEGFMF